MAKTLILIGSFFIQRSLTSCYISRVLRVFEQHYACPMAVRTTRDVELTNERKSAASEQIGEINLSQAIAMAS
jgi:hypothetical protein